MFSDEQSWFRCNPDDLWVYDKLILARKLGYLCGPIGVPVPKPDYYIVRPCVNFMGMGQGAEIVWIEDETDDLPIGYFWCEVFNGRHLSVDYRSGEQTLCVEGIKPVNTPLYRWEKWVKVDDVIPYPSILTKSFEYVNCEFIDGYLIEVHLRHNPDYQHQSNLMIPVWKDQDISPPVGMKYVPDPDFHRIGFYILDPAAS